MKNNESTIFVFIASIIIGVLISLNINFKGNISSFQMSAKQYQDAYNQRNKLYVEISNIRQNNNNIIKKINTYKLTELKNEKITDVMNEELDDNNRLVGFKGAMGPGLIITIRDGTSDYPSDYESQSTILYRILHDDDMIRVVNELKVGGAEAISINGERVLLNTEIICSWAFLRMNGEKLPVPFIVTAIGDPDALEANLKRDGGYIRTLINRGIQVDIKKSNEVIVPAYNGNSNFDNLMPKASEKK